MRGKRKREGSERQNDRKIAQEIQQILEVVGKKFRRHGIMLHA